MPPTYDSIPVSSRGKTLGKGEGSETGESNYKSKLFVAGLIAMCAVVTLLAVSTSSTFSMPAAQPALPSSLSERAQEIKPVRDDIAMFTAGTMDPYHPTENKDGYLVMLVAENKLMYSELAAKVQEVSSSGQPIPQWVFDYGDLGGQADFKASMAKVMQRWIIPHVNPDNLRFQAGAGSILDCLAFCLANPDDGVLVAGPNYPAFTSDFGLKSHARLHVAGTRASNNYEPTVQELDDAFDRSMAAGNPPKILIICQPNNPTGAIYSPESMRLQIKWALEKGLHVVSDEIYALSVFPGQATTSAAQIMSEINIDEEKYLGDRVHVVAGLSKDWGMSGFRVGSLFTHNKKVLQIVNILEYYQAVSQYTQHTLTAIFEDDAWVDWYIRENQRRLAATFDALEEALSLIGAPLFKSKGALFAWADFSSFLQEGQTEKELWLELFKDAKVMFTTGESCKGEKPGLFRVVYTWPEGGVEAMRELGQRLVKWKNERTIN